MNLENKNDLKKKAFEILSDGVKNRDSLFHTLTLSTIDRGKIDSRVMVLREFIAKKRYLKFHTDQRSKKIQEIKSNPVAAVIGYDPSQKIQIRLQGNLSFSHQDNKTSEAWNASQHISKKCYSVKSGSSSVIKSPASHDFHIKDVNLEEGYKNFSILNFSFDSLEFLYLQRSGHRRCKFVWSKNKLESYWLVP